MLRILSAAVLVGVLVTTVWFLPPWCTAALASAIAAIAAAEVAGLASKAGSSVPAALPAIAAASLVASFVILEDTSARALSTDTVVSVLLALIVCAGAAAITLGPPALPTMTTAAVMVMAPVYVGLPLGAIAWIHWTYGAAATTFLVAMLAVSDTAQYYVGRTFGRRKLAPTISPGKTIEGLLGGLVAAALAGSALGTWQPRAWHPGFWHPATLGPWMALALGLALAAVGVLGDLFESLLKRSVGAKDSSALIPGHGGMLDRIDSYLFAAPVFYLFLRYVR